MPAPCSMSLAGRERNWRQAGKPSFPRRSILPEGDKMKGSDLVVKSKPERKRVPVFPSAHVRNHRITESAAATESMTLKVDERLQLARERREAHLKQLASRERGWLAREEKARRFYQKHLEERRKKLEDQRLKEERRRNAVEEKRKQRLKEERERYESVVQKTIERSEKVKQRSTQRRVLNPKNNTNAKRRSLSQWEINLVNRLQTPTISYLARSRSATCLSRGEVSCHTVSNSEPQTHHKTMKPGGTQLSTQTAANKPGSNLKRREQKKPHSHTASVKTSSMSETEGKTICSLPGTRTRLTLRESPSQECLPPLPEGDGPDPETQNSHEPQRDPSAAVCSHKNRHDGVMVQDNPGSNRPLAAPAFPHTPKDPSVGHQSRLSAGTTDPEEASRLLAEKRRQARLQRERDEEECRQQEELERRAREELTFRRAEERERHEAEARREQWRREEEDRMKVEEEERRLLQQKEEEERQRLERETRFQIEECERQKRKKRLEEIMKRTRKTEAEKKPMLSSTTLNENVKTLHSLPLDDVIRFPSSAKDSMVSLTNEEDILPTVAFKERKSIRTLRHLEEIQGHQQAEVI